MPKTLIKSRLHSNKHKPKIKQDLNNTKSNYLHIFTHLNKNFYQVTASLNLNEYFILYK